MGGGEGIGMFRAGSVKRAVSSTAERLEFNAASRSQRPCIRKNRDGGAQDVHFDFHIASEL